MINVATLEGLQDDELKTTQSLIDEILHRRDEERKAKALEDARAIDAKALTEKRAILAAAGLSLKDLNGKARSKGTKVATYRGGHTYQHPSNKTLVWNAKGKKPNWLVDLEASGLKPVEIAGAS